MAKTGLCLGSFLAPSGAIRVDKESVITGLLYGRSVDLDKDVQVTAAPVGSIRPTFITDRAGPVTGAGAPPQVIDGWTAETESDSIYLPITQRDGSPPGDPAVAAEMHRHLFLPAITR